MKKRRCGEKLSIEEEFELACREEMRKVIDKSKWKKKNKILKYVFLS